MENTDQPSRDLKKLISERLKELEDSEEKDVVKKKRVSTRRFLRHE